MYKKGVIETKEGGLSLIKKRGGVGVQYKNKKGGPGGPQNEKK